MRVGSIGAMGTSYYYIAATLGKINASGGETQKAAIMFNT